MTHHKERCKATEDHLRHLENLKGIPDTASRREYLDGVRRSEGAFYADWLRDAYTAWHKESKQKSHD